MNQLGKASYARTRSDRYGGLEFGFGSVTRQQRKRMAWALSRGEGDTSTLKRATQPKDRSSEPTSMSTTTTPPPPPSPSSGFSCTLSNGIVMSKYATATSAVMTSTPYGKNVIASAPDSGRNINGSFYVWFYCPEDISSTLNYVCVYISVREASGSTENPAGAVMAIPESEYVVAGLALMGICVEKGYTLPTASSLYAIVAGPYTVPSDLSASLVDGADYNPFSTVQSAFEYLYNGSGSQSYENSNDGSTVNTYQQDTTLFNIADNTNNVGTATLPNGTTCPYLMLSFAPNMSTGAAFDSDHSYWPYGQITQNVYDEV